MKRKKTQPINTCGVIEVDAAVKTTTPVASSSGDDGETAFTDDRKEHRLTLGRPQRDDHRNWHRWDCSES